MRRPRREALVLVLAGLWRGPWGPRGAVPEVHRVPHVRVAVRRGATDEAPRHELWVVEHLVARQRRRNRRVRSEELEQLVTGSGGDGGGESGRDVVGALASLREVEVAEVVEPEPVAQRAAQKCCSLMTPSVIQEPSAVRNDP